MKNYLPLLTLLILTTTTNNAFGQESQYAGGTVTYGSSQPPQSTSNKLSDTLSINDKITRTSLQYKWRIIFKDDSTYKAANFDDKSWEETRIDTEYHQLNKLKSDTVAWFRKTLYVDSATVELPLLFFIRSAGSWEFYVDGELQDTFGKIDQPDRQALINLSDKRIPFTFKESGKHSLAFRFLLDETAKLNKDSGIRLMRISVGRSDQDTYNKESFDMKEAIGILVGLFLLAAVIHWFFYYQFKTDKRDSYNLYAFISMLLFAVYGYFSSPSIRTFSVDWLVFRNLIESFSFVAGHCMLLVAVHNYLHQKYNKLIWGTVVIALLFAFVSDFIFNEAFADYGDAATALLFIGVYIYLIVMAKRNKVKSSKTLRNALLYFLITFLSSFLLIILVVMFSFSYGTDMQRDVFATLSIIIVIILAGPQLAVSFAISADLAKEFVQTNIVLNKKIEELKQLSSEKAEILTQQNEKLEELVSKRTAELNQSVVDLKATQDQLVQSEKLASLGELTAGIAHEIQNPLNFVNNFSEVSAELVDEMNEELTNGDMEEVKFISVDLKQNLEKINHHGLRASGIVKSMLEHSKMSDGHKEPTNINALADEYLRLAYHGLRAKDRSFNAKMETHFDSEIPEVNVIPQDIGRVLLNIINNAFQSPDPSNAQTDYMKNVTVTTHNDENSATIAIADNGAGIPDNIREKIFQPFFTTKPTGQGTGLGLSLAYDIVKAHGGEIKVVSDEDTGCEFKITLPISAT